MKREDFERLAEGDEVRHVDGWQGYIVHGNYLRGGVLIVRAQVIHNPQEWDLVRKVEQE